MPFIQEYLYMTPANDMNNQLEWRHIQLEDGALTALETALTADKTIIATNRCRVYKSS